MEESVAPDAVVGDDGGGAPESSAIGPDPDVADSVVVAGCVVVAVGCPGEDGGGACTTGGIATAGIATGIATAGIATAGIAGIATGGIGGIDGDSNAPKIVCVTVCVVDEMFAMLDEITEFVWVTSPSFPGLRIRIEIDVLHMSQPTGGGPSGVVQSQFQIHVDAARSSGVIVGAVVLPSAEFHDQFQTQVDGTFGVESAVGLTAGVVGAAGMSGVELIPPELPL